MRRIFVAEPEPERLYVFINPEIITMEGEQESEEAACPFRDIQVWL